MVRAESQVWTRVGKAVRAEELEEVQDKKVEEESYKKGVNKEEPSSTSRKCS